MHLGPNVSRSDTHDGTGLLRHDTFCVRDTSIAVVLFNRNFTSTVPLFALQPLFNIGLAISLPPWLGERHELVAYELLGNRGERELQLKWVGYLGWSDVVQVEIPWLEAGTVVRVSRRHQSVQ